MESSLLLQPFSRGSVEKRAEKFRGGEKRFTFAPRGKKRENKKKEKRDL